MGKEKDSTELLAHPWFKDIDIKAIETRTAEIPMSFIPPIDDDEIDPNNIKMSENMNMLDTYIPV